MGRLVPLLSVLLYLVLADAEVPALSDSLPSEEPRNSCPTPGSLPSSTCARVFDHQHCKSTSQDFGVTSGCTYLGGWDDTISSIIVRTGCVFVGWKDSSCSGDSGSWSESEGANMMGDIFGNKVTSYTCHCDL